MYSCIPSHFSPGSKEPRYIGSYIPTNHRVPVPNQLHYENLRSIDAARISVYAQLPTIYAGKLGGGWVERTGIISVLGVFRQPLGPSIARPC